MNYPTTRDEVAIPDHLDLNKADDAIIDDLLEHVADLPANIAERTDYDRMYVHQRLKRLNEHKIVRNRGNGVYELVSSE
jgi:hypothetical protein